MAPDERVEMSIGVLRPVPTFRRVASREPFPPCRALAAWPANYPVGELADLDEEEAAETDPARFVFSDAECDGWRGIVTALLDELEGPRLGRRKRWVLPPRRRRCNGDFLAFLRKHHPSLFAPVSTGARVEERAGGGEA
jgi:hypothetical protein